MNEELVLFVLFCAMGLSLTIGLLLGVNLYAKSNCAGDLVIAPGDEDAQNYMFLDLTLTPEYLSEQDMVVLRIKRIETRK